MVHNGHSGRNYQTSSIGGSKMADNQEQKDYDRNDQATRPQGANQTPAESESQWTTYYSFDEQGNYTGDGLATDPSKVPDNATTIPPTEVQNGLVVMLENPTFDKEKQIWIEHTDPIEPSETQKLLMQQSQQIALLQSTVMQQNQASAKLQATNSQQTNQIKQLQQMFMQANQQQAIAKSKEEAQQ